MSWSTFAERATTVAPNRMTGAAAPVDGRTQEESKRVFIASRNGRRSIALVAAAALLLSGCGAAATPAPSWPAGAIVVTARNSTFDTKELHFQSGATTQLVLVNEDSDEHDIEIWTKAGSDGAKLFHSELITRTSIVLTVGPLAAGTYYFVCGVHSRMNGTVVVN